MDTLSGPKSSIPFRVLSAALAAILFGGTVAVSLHVWFAVGGPSLDYLCEGPLYDAVILAAGLACLLRATRVESERGAWAMIGLAILSWGASEVYWTAFILHNPSPPYPSPADVGNLAFYPLAATGVILLVRARAHELDWRLWMDGLIAALGTAALGAAFVFDFVAKQTSGSPLQVATTLAYPLGDIAMLALVVGVVALTGWRPGRTWSLLLSGLMVLVIADTAYTLQTNGASLPGGDWTDPIYLIAAACLGAMLWQPSAERIRASTGFEGWRELVVPALSAAVMIGLFALQYFSAISGLSTVLWAATMIAVIVRLAVSVRENKALLEQVRTDPLTGLYNRGGMQVDLEARCERAEQEELTLVLYDLNGFKRYNDTFGHPAGDQLLARLGAQLRAAVKDRGAAYRIGGDEFCVLLGGPPAAVEATKRAAAKALTASGRGYQVSSSWGAVRIPEEAADPAAAMQLADVRMYAQKESRRLAPREDGDGGIRLTAWPQISSTPSIS